MTMAPCRALRSRRINSSTCASVVLSSAVVGSSSTSKSGSQAMAQASTTRWRCPPES